MSVYTPEHFRMDDRAAIARLMHDHPFATLLTPSMPEPMLSHVPLLLVPDAEPNGTLIGHVARANPHWQHATGAESVAIFHGPHAYVSPSWFAEPSKGVPTWNYAVVHAYGMLDVIDEPVEKRSDRLTKRNCALDQRTISSAKRDRWVAQIDAAARNSSAKSRSLTASSEFAIGRSNPSASAVIARSIGKEVPASAAAPSGHSLSRHRQSASRPRSRPSIST